MKIGLDFDDVLAHSQLLKVAIVLELFGHSVSPYDYCRDYVVERGLMTDEQCARVSEHLFSCDRPVPPVQYAPLYLRKLEEEGHDIRIVTSRSDRQGNLDTARKWLRSQGFSFPITGVGYGLSKKDACKGLNLFVDDDVEKLTPLIGEVPHLLRFTWPHDRYVVTPPGIVEARSWSEIYRYIQEVS